MLVLLDLVKSGQIGLIGSVALDFEASNNPDQSRRDYTVETLARASAYVELTASVRRRGDVLNRAGLGMLDALHLASAEAAGADYLCTCDDELLKKGPCVAEAGVRVVSPVDLARAFDEPPSRT